MCQRQLLAGVARDAKAAQPERLDAAVRGAEASADGVCSVQVQLSSSSKHAQSRHGAGLDHAHALDEGRGFPNSVKASADRGVVGQSHPRWCLHRGGIVQRHLRWCLYRVSHS